MRIIVLSFTALAILTLTTFAQTEHPRPRSISGGVLNDRAIERIDPEYPEIAKESGAEGDVVIEVRISENGDVISAEGISGPPLLIPAAVEAATRTRFRPLEFEGRPIVTTGVIRYNFVYKRVNWHGFAKAISATYAYDNLELRPVAEYLTAEYETEKQQLLALDRDPRIERHRVIKSVMSAIRARLQGRNLWYYDLGVALTDVMLPLRTHEVDRQKLKAALAGLNMLQAAIPEDVSPRDIEGVRILTEFRIGETQSSEELRKQIFRMLANIQHDSR